jgi:hypothetical protein
MPNAPQILPQNDKALIKAVREGRVWEPVEEPPTPEQLADPTFFATMPAIQATTIRALCLGLWDDVIADPQGVQVMGARIVGELDLSFGMGRCRLALVHCHFAEQLVVQNAHLPALTLSGSHLAMGLKGDGVHIAGDLFCRNGFTSKGTVRLLGAQIGGDVSFSGANLDGGIRATLQDGTTGTLQNGTTVTLSDNRVATLNPGPVAKLSDGTDVPLKAGTTLTLQDGSIATLDGGTGTALSADRMVVTGSVFCSKDFTSKDFTSKGEVRLLGAQIGANLAFRGATLDGGMEDALSADGAVVKGDLFCDGGFTSKGEVRLLGAQIGGDVSFNGANLDSRIRATLQDGTTVLLEIGLTVTFSDNQVATLNPGPVAKLSDGTDVPLKAGTTLTLQDGSIATLYGGKGTALSADRMIVMGSLFCRKSFKYHGQIGLVAVKIGSLLDWRPTEGSGLLNLSHTTAGQWADNWGKEEKNGAKEKKAKPTLNLNHFTYGAFAGDDTETDSDTRIAWIEASQGDNFKPGPYRTLARVLRAAGDDRGAQDVGLALARARAKHLAKTYSWPLNWLHRLLSGFFDVAIGHGYRPWRGAVWLLYLQIIGTIAFGLNAPTIYDCTPNGDCHNIGGPGLIKPADPVFITENQTRNLQAPSPTAHDIAYTLPPEYTPFNAFWYSFDTLIPLIDLGQEKAWSPSPLTTKISDDIPGWALLFYLYFHIIMGWVLSTLTVVALTGLIKRDPEGEE